MTLKVVVTPLYLLSNVAFHVDNIVWLENMHILANMRSEICIKICHYLGGDKEGGGSRQTVTNSDKGGGGVKNRDFYGDILFEWPHYIRERFKITIVTCH